MNNDLRDHQQPANQLTEAQRRCLRLVLAHMTSKEIARELQLSPHTVDAHIKAAMKTLGTGSRVEAARMLAAIESPDGEPSPSDQPLVHQRLGMAITSGLEEIGPVKERSSLVMKDVDYTNLVETNSEQSSNSVHDAFAGTGSAIRQNEGPLDRFGKSEDNSQNVENKLSIYKRLLIIIVICISSVSVTVLAMSALNLLSGLYN